MVAGAAEAAVVGRALLLAVGLAHRAVHVEDDPGELAVMTGAVDPQARQVHQLIQIRLGRQRLGLEAGHLASRSGHGVTGPPTDDSAQGGVDTEAFGVVEVLVAGQAPIDRLA